MPIYDYCCENCGIFEEMAPMSAYLEPVACPNCSVSSSRVMVTAPRIGGISKAMNTAHETNERSADSPKRSSHGPGCGCCSGGGKKINSGTLYQADGSKSFPAKRPWMISH